MLVLFETSAGYALFKVVDENKLRKTENIYKEFETPDKASKLLKLHSFKQFKDTTDALEATTSMLDGKIGKSMKKFLKKCAISDVQEQIAVADAKLGGLIKDKLELPCVHSPAVDELMRGIRSQLDTFLGDITPKDFIATQLGLAHSLSRYKLKFNPEKVDTMIIQAVSLLDDLDKELNNYVMRLREWYGWHFPELSKVVTDHLAFAKIAKKLGQREKLADTDLSDILPPELEAAVKTAGQTSMGTEVSDLDIFNIRCLCDQVIEITDYRTQLFEYLKNRMMALAPNLTVLLGELVAARLIAHAGSLMNLAKYPASTVQILGAEKALFRALKTKKDTPKYGLLYHAQLVGQAPGKIKGKMSRMLAAKAALGCRVDALADDSNGAMGIDHKAYLEQRLQTLSTQGTSRLSGQGKFQAKQEKHYFKRDAPAAFNDSADSTMPAAKKAKFEEPEEEEEKKEVETPKQKKKRKKSEPTEETEIKEEVQDAGYTNGDAEEAVDSSAKKKKKKKKSEVSE